MRFWPRYGMGEAHLSMGPMAISLPHAWLREGPCDPPTLRRDAARLRKGNRSFQTVANKAGSEQRATSKIEKCLCRAAGAARSRRSATSSAAWSPDAGAIGYRGPPPQCCQSGEVLLRRQTSWTFWRETRAARRAADVAILSRRFASPLSSLAPTQVAAKRHYSERR